MAGVYVDTSALGRVLLGEPGAAAVLRDLGAFEQHLSSRLLRVELRRVALREGRLSDADRLLTRVSLLPVDEAVLEASETVGPPAVGTLDAIHLVTAMRLAGAGFVDALMTFDQRLGDGARAQGLSVVVPA